MGERVIWTAGEVEKGLREATRVVALWSAGQRAPNHDQRRHLGMAPEQRARRASLIVPTQDELRAAEAVLACLVAIDDLRLRRLVQARATGASWSRLQVIDRRDRREIKRLVTAAYRTIATALNNPVANSDGKVGTGEGSNVHVAA